MKYIRTSDDLFCWEFEGLVLIAGKSP